MQNNRCRTQSCTSPAPASAITATGVARCDEAAFQYSSTRQSGAVIPPAGFADHHGKSSSAYPRCANVRTNLRMNGTMHRATHCQDLSTHIMEVLHAHLLLSEPLVSARYAATSAADRLCCHFDAQQAKTLPCTGPSPLNRVNNKCQPASDSPHGKHCCHFCSRAQNPNRYSARNDSYSTSPGTTRAICADAKNMDA